MSYQWPGGILNDRLTIHGTAASRSILEIMNTTVTPWHPGKWTPVLARYPWGYVEINRV